jgi:hypothetical protein
VHLNFQWIGLLTLDGLVCLDQGQYYWSLGVGFRVYIREPQPQYLKWGALSFVKAVETSVFIFKFLMLCHLLNNATIPRAI